jgi:predicted small secreted protein
MFGDAALAIGFFRIEFDTVGDQSSMRRTFSREATMATYKTIRSLIMVALMGMVLGSVTACNTIAGAGKDTQKAGEHIENAADNAK